MPSTKTPRRAMTATARWPARSGTPGRPPIPHPRRRAAGRRPATGSAAEPGVQHSRAALGKPDTSRSRGRRAEGRRQPASGVIRARRRSGLLPRAPRDGWRPRPLRVVDGAVYDAAESSTQGSLPPSPTPSGCPRRTRRHLSPPRNTRPRPAGGQPSVLRAAPAARLRRSGCAHLLRPRCRAASTGVARPLRTRLPLRHL